MCFECSDYDEEFSDFEFHLPLIEPFKEGRDLVDHLQACLEAARLLQREGWTLQPTCQSIGCNPPPTFEGNMAAYLRGLGLDNKLICAGLYWMPVPTLTEIHEAEREYWEQVQYHHYEITIPGLKYRLEISSEDAERIEQEYGGYENLRAGGPIELGVLIGRLDALRWVLGFDWDEPDC